ncbi:MAG: DNA-directed RNA polymerase [Candidatus Hydrothermarchaeota archaeon]
MYRIVTIKDIVAVPPERFGEDLESVIKDILRETYEGILDKELGVIILISNIKDIGIGKIAPGDGSAYHEVTFDALTFKPDMQEVLEGEVVEIVDFGAFVRLGPLDGLIHISQIMEDYIVHDSKGGALIGKETHKTLKEGDKVRARVVAVSLNPRELRESKIGLTMRQKGLGKIEWIKAEKEEKK